VSSVEFCNVIVVTERFVDRLIEPSQALCDIAQFGFGQSCISMDAPFHDIAEEYALTRQLCSFPKAVTVIQPASFDSLRTRKRQGLLS
jgi:hypothetical protein